MKLMWELGHTQTLFSLRAVKPLDISFEFFPPKTSEAADSLRQTARRLAPLAPRFFSVTCGANGSSYETARETTAATVHQIGAHTSVPVAAHMTCVGASREQIADRARAYWDSGVRHIVALRGDCPADNAYLREPPEGYANAAELVAGLKRVANFEISVAAYPEIHPESDSSLADLENLKRKVDAGATRAITQFFFDTDAFLRFVERARLMGISIPIVPGILPLYNYAQTVKFARRCGATIPSWLTHLFEGLDNDPQTRQMVAASVTAEQCRVLQGAGVHEFHFYTLNRAELTYAVCHMLGLRSRTPTKQEAA